MKFSELYAAYSQYMALAESLAMKRYEAEYGKRWYVVNISAKIGMHGVDVDIEDIEDDVGFRGYCISAEELDERIDK